MLSDTIKQIVRNTEDSSMPMAIMYGEVQSISPLRIQVDSRFPIEGEAIILPRDTLLEVSDKVILLRNRGGQQYLVIGRL